MLVYRSFESNKIQKANDLQQEAYINAMQSNDIYVYNKNDVVFSLEKCSKFKDAMMFRDTDQIIKGIVYNVEKIELQLLSTDPNIGTAFIGDENGSNLSSIALHNYIVYYMDSIVEIKQGEQVWYYNSKLIIGWHGSYSPPTGM